MRKIFSKALFLASLLLVSIGPVTAQGAGTVHGVLVTLTTLAVGAPAGNGNTIAGYNIYRCAGTCTASSTFTKIDATLDLSTGYLDPASDTALTAGATFTFAATNVDNLGNESGFSPLSTVTIPTTGFPANPGAPSGCSAKVQ